MIYTHPLIEQVSQVLLAFSEQWSLQAFSLYALPGEQTFDHIGESPIVVAEFLSP
jgi:hypothetical protein